MAPVWRLPGCLCCWGAAGDSSMASQPAPSTNPSLCLPCKSQISSWVAEMRQIMLYLMTYLMAHFPEVMRTYNYPHAQCELWLLCKQKVQTRLPHFKQVKVKKPQILDPFPSCNNVKCQYIKIKDFLPLTLMALWAWAGRIGLSRKLSSSCTLWPCSASLVLLSCSALAHQSLLRAPLGAGYPLGQFWDPVDCKVLAFPSSFGWS